MYNLQDVPVGLPVLVRQHCANSSTTCIVIMKTKLSDNGRCVFITSCSPDGKPHSYEFMKNVLLAGGALSVFEGWYRTDKLGEVFEYVDTLELTRSQTPPIPPPPPFPPARLQSEDWSLLKGR